MRVEVNEQNIVIFGLVQLTGNSAETLLRHAAEATEAGYVLTCELPDIEDVIDMNVFEAANAEPAGPVEHKENPMMTKEERPDA